MVRVSQGVKRFEARADAIKSEAKSESRKVTKEEVAGALHEMVKNDGLSKADRKAAEKLLDSDIPLTPDAKNLVEGFSEGDRQSLLDVRLGGVQGSRDLVDNVDTSAVTTAKERVYSSLGRLDAMVDLFTDRGNRKLDSGEIHALAGFYGGLKSSSQAKIRDRMVEIYQQSKFSSGQQDEFRKLLEMRGFSRGELEGVDPSTPTGFDGMSAGAKVDHLHYIYSESYDRIAEYSSLRDFADGDITDAAYGKITATIQEIVASQQAELDRSGEEDPNVFAGDMKTIYHVNEDGDPDMSTKLAIGFEVHQTFGNGGNTQTHYFELTGNYLGSDILFEE